MSYLDHFEDGLEREELCDRCQRAEHEHLADWDGVESLLCGTCVAEEGAPLIG